MTDNGSLQEIAALVGYPVSGSPLQYMIEKAFAQLALEWRYLSLDVTPDGLADAVRGMQALGFQGGNVATPHKVAICQHFESLTESAQQAGWVNCFYRHDGRLVGDNNFGQAVLQAIGGPESLNDAPAIILGSGPTARAIALQLVHTGVNSITVVNRSPERGRALTEALRGSTDKHVEFVLWDTPFRAPAETRLLINATSIASAVEELAIEWDELPASAIVADSGAMSADSGFLRHAHERGATLVDGLTLLVNQAAIAMETWTGQAPDRTLMREAGEEFLGM